MVGIFASGLLTNCGHSRQANRESSVGSSTGPSVGSSAGPSVGSSAGASDGASIGSTAAPTATSNSDAAVANASARGPLVLTYLGVAGWELDAGAHTLLVDPYFTRQRIKEDGTVAKPDSAAIARYAPAHADVILVEHSHYDHLLDVPEIARRTGAMVVGTESTVNVARASGIGDEHALVARAGEALTFGPFTVDVKNGLHALTGIPNVPIPKGVTTPMRSGDYGEGSTLHYVVHVQGRTVLFISSANYIEAELANVRPDVLVVATGLREAIPDYTCRLVNALGHPKLVLANHFDNFGTPLTPHKNTLSDDARHDLDAFANEVHACSPDSKVIVPSHLEAFSL